MGLLKSNERMCPNVATVLVETIFILEKLCYLENHVTDKLGFKELLNEEQIGNGEPFPVTNLPV